MTDASTFGGQLDPGTVFGAGFGGAGSTPAADAVPPVQPTASAAPGQSSFGSALNIMKGPQYSAPDPKTSALDQTATTLQQRIDRANQIATNPVLQFFNPEGVQKARDFVPQATEELLKLRQQKQQQADIQATANNYGVPKPAQNPFMTNDTIDNYLLDQYKSGDFTAANALKARGKGDWVQYFAAQAVDGAGQRLKAADSAATKLSAAQGNQAAYNAARNSLTPEDTAALTAMGIQNIPEKAADWQNIVAQHGAKFAQAQQLHAQVLQKLNNMSNFDGTAPKEVAEQMQGDIRLGSTNEPAGFPVRIRSSDGQPGHVAPNGSVQTEKYGLSTKEGGWSASNPEREKSFQTVLNQDDVKGAVNQYNIANKFRHEANDESNYTSAAGLALLKDTLGGVGRDVAEKSAAAGTVGLTAMMTKQQGGFEGWANRAQNELGAFQNWLNAGKKGPEPRISDATKKGLQLVAETNYQYALDQAKGRLGGAMTYAGQIGKPLDQIPLDADLKKDLASMHEAGRVDAINGYRALPSIVRGDQRVFFTQGANVPGATPARPPLPTSVPAAPNTTPGNPPPPPVNNQPLQPGGGGTPPAPIVIAGQSIMPNLPPGVSPNYLPAMQRIESGGSKNPWTATTPGSSASGAFQMIDSTWNANKPAGAPARAKDATPEQQTQANDKFMAGNAQALTAAGLPVNDTNMYVAHNLGGAGATALLHADPNADARTTVGAAAANNNPTFFKGRPTVATVLQRYGAEMNKEPSKTPTAAGLPDVGAAPWTGRTTLAGDAIATPEQRANSPVVREAPAIGSTVGALAGTAGGPAGSVAGGAAGGGAGQAFKDYMQGRPQDPVAIAKQAALGGVLGVASETRPVLAAAARVAGVGGADAAVTAAQGSDTADVLKSAAEGGAYALGGEALGRFVSSAGAQAYKALSRYTTASQAELSASAGKLAEARKIMDSEQPKLPGDVGPNPKYEAAKQAADDATQAIKDHGQNPDDMVHAYEQAKAGVSAGEAAVMRSAVREKATVSQGYNELRQQVADTGVGAPKPNQAVPNGPIAQLRTAENPTGKVPEQFRPEAEHAEMLVKAPAANWGEKWQQLQNAGSELIQKRLSFLANNDKPSADAMDALFQGVRKQQEAAASYVFGPERGAKIISNLENLDTRYAKVMNATQGMSYGKMQSVLASGNTPERRELEKNFTEFAKGDPSAVRAFNAMKAGARGDWKSEAQLMAPVIAGEVAANLHGVPTVGAISALVGGHRLYKLVQGYMNARVLGKAVMFKDFLANEIKTGGLSLAAAAAQRGAVMQ
jgi:hypothetical protein